MRGLLSGHRDDRFSLGIHLYGRVRTHVRRSFLELALRAGARLYLLR